MKNVQKFQPGRDLLASCAAISSSYCRTLASNGSRMRLLNFEIKSAHAFSLSCELSSRVCAIAGVGKRSGGTSFFKSRTCAIRSGLFLLVSFRSARSLSKTVLVLFPGQLVMLFCRSLSSSGSLELSRHLGSLAATVSGTTTCKTIHSQASCCSRLPSGWAVSLIHSCSRCRSLDLYVSLSSHRNRYIFR